MALADIQLAKTDHPDLFEVKNPEKARSKRQSQVTTLRNAARRDGNTDSVVQRGERIFLVLNDRDGKGKDKQNPEARKHLPVQTREGGVKLSDLIAKAS